MSDDNYEVFDPRTDGEAEESEYETLGAVGFSSGAGGSESDDPPKQSDLPKPGSGFSRSFLEANRGVKNPKLKFEKAPRGADVAQKEIQEVFVEGKVPGSIGAYYMNEGTVEKLVRKGTLVQEDWIPKNQLPLVGGKYKHKGDKLVLKLDEDKLPASVQWSKKGVSKRRGQTFTYWQGPRVLRSTEQKRLVGKAEEMQNCHAKHLFGKKDHTDLPTVTKDVRRQKWLETQRNSTSDDDDANDDGDDFVSPKRRRGRAAFMSPSGARWYTMNSDDRELMLGPRQERTRSMSRQERRRFVEDIASSRSSSEGGTSSDSRGTSQFNSSGSDTSDDPDSSPGRGSKGSKERSRRPGHDAIRRESAACRTYVDLDLGSERSVASAASSSKRRTQKRLEKEISLDVFAGDVAKSVVHAAGRAHRRAEEVGRKEEEKSESSRRSHTHGDKHGHKKNKYSSSRHGKSHRRGSKSLKDRSRSQSSKYEKSSSPSSSDSEIPRREKPGSKGEEKPESSRRSHTHGDKHGHKKNKYSSSRHGKSHRRGSKSLKDRSRSQSSKYVKSSSSSSSDSEIPRREESKSKRIKNKQKLQEAESSDAREWERILDDTKGKGPKELLKFLGRKLDKGSGYEVIPKPTGELEKLFDKGTQWRGKHLSKCTKLLSRMLSSNAYWQMSGSHKRQPISYAKRQAGEAIAKVTEADLNAHYTTYPQFSSRKSDWLRDITALENWHSNMNAELRRTNQEQSFTVGVQMIRREVARCATEKEPMTPILSLFNTVISRPSQNSSERREPEWRLYEMAMGLVESQFSVGGVTKGDEEGVVSEVCDDFINAIFTKIARTHSDEECQMWQLQLKVQTALRKLHSLSWDSARAHPKGAHMLFYLGSLIMKVMVGEFEKCRRIVEQSSVGFSEKWKYDDPFRFVGARLYEAVQSVKILSKRSANETIKPSSSYMYPVEKEKFLEVLKPAAIEDEETTQKRLINNLKGGGGDNPKFHGGGPTPGGGSGGGNNPDDDSDDNKEKEKKNDPGKKTFGGIECTDEQKKVLKKLVWNQAFWEAARAAGWTLSSEFPPKKKMPIQFIGDWQSCTEWGLWKHQDEKLLSFDKVVFKKKKVWQSEIPRAICFLCLLGMCPAGEMCALSHGNFSGLFDLAKVVTFVAKILNKQVDFKVEDFVLELSSDYSDHLKKWKGKKNLLAGLTHEQMVARTNDQNKEATKIGIDCCERCPVRTPMGKASVTDKTRFEQLNTAIKTCDELKSMSALISAMTDDGPLF